MLLLVFGLFFQSLNTTKCHILIKTAAPHAVKDADAVQSASAVNKMKLEPKIISFMENTTSSKMVEQNDDFIVKESRKSLSVF